MTARGVYGGAMPKPFEEPPLSLQGELRIEIDSATTIVRVFGSGMWPEPYARAHFEELDRTLRRLRSRGSPLRVLVDIRDAVVQKPETAQCVSAATNNIYRSCDRIAIVVASSLLKLQIRRSTDTGLHRLFSSYNAAETWLLALE